MEEMLRTYKEEVDTLNEALKIAAMDIAEVAEAEDDYFLSDEDDVDGEEEVDLSHGGEDGGGEDSLSVSAASESVSFASARDEGGDGGRSSGRTSKAVLYREALRDSATAGTGSATPVSQQRTFVVREDGTFDKT